MNEITRQQISEFLVDSLSVQREEFEDDTLLFSEGILDSLNLLELITFIERRMGRRIRSRDITLAHFDSVNRILEFQKTLAAGHEN